MPRLTQQQLEAHLWGAANILRGRTAGQDYKTYILSLIFFKRLCDQWDYEADEKIRELEGQRGEPFSEEQREALRASAAIHRFTIPPGCHWYDVRKAATNVGEVLTTAMRGIANANRELTGVFTVDWNAPAPDGKARLIATNVVSTLIEHFHEVNLSNGTVPLDVLGRAYEYLIKQFADDAGAKAGEFFTPSEVVDVLVRIVEPQPGETVYDPTCGSGGMLVHSADYVKEHGYTPDQVRYFGQEMNWSTYAIARINMILHGMEADIRGGKSTISDPLFMKADGSIEHFDVVLANFPFSDEFWWLPEDQRTEEQAKKAKKQFKEFKDKYKRFVFGKPPAGFGDFAFIQHILASTTAKGRCGVVCPQGVLFRGQPEIEEETGEYDEDGKLEMRRRKADDEYLIRKGLLEARVIDAVIALPLNVFYGAGVPACLLILHKDRSAERKDKVLLVYAARHYRELSSKNQLRPQDVMRILVHYHAYGDASKAAGFAESHSRRLQAVVDREETEEIARITAEYQSQAGKLTATTTELEQLRRELEAATAKKDREKLEKKIARLKSSTEKLQKELAKRDERIADVKKQAAEDRQAIHDVAQELATMYKDTAELVKHVRVVDWAEFEENEFNLNIPRYVDTFEPEEPVDVNQALLELDAAEKARRQAEEGLRRLLREVGYAAN